MNYLRICLVSILTLFAVSSMNAQEQDKDFFVGKWEISVLGSPRGDYKIGLVVTRENDELQATITPGEEDPIKATRVGEKKNKSITVYYTSGSGFDVSLFLEKADDDAIKGSVMNMFQATGKRIKE